MYFILFYFYFTLLCFQGNFVDLVSKKWYDGMPLQKVEQLTVQTGKPPGGEGYTDPKTKQVQHVLYVQYVQYVLIASVLIAINKMCK
jgi:Cyclophilin type peptidyl-prolyl cis-trans isomerase/CLD